MNHQQLARINQVSQAVGAASPVLDAVSKVIAIYVVTSEMQDLENMRELHENMLEIFQYLRRWSDEAYEPMNDLLMQAEQYEFYRWIGNINSDRDVKACIKYYKHTQPLRDRLQMLMEEADKEMNFSNGAYNNGRPLPILKYVAPPEMN